MNRRSFLSIMGVGIACPLSLLKAGPPKLKWSELTQEQLAESFRKAFKNTKFKKPIFLERRGRGERRQIATYYAPAKTWFIINPKTYRGKLL